MSDILKFINSQAKRKVLRAEHKFSDGETRDVYFREISEKTRADLFQARLVKDASGNFTLDITSPAGGLHMNAEVLAETLCDENGKLLATKDAILDWPSSLVTDLSTLAMKTLKLLPEAEPKADPSKATS